jgi:hypothetical protein
MHKFTEENPNPLKQNTLQKNVLKEQSKQGIFGEALILR